MQTHSTSKPLNLIISWVLISVCSAALGAYIAVNLFPIPGFAQSTEKEVIVSLLSLALLIGVSLGGAQYLVLKKAFQDHYRAIDAWLIFWIPATLFGVIFLIVPLYYVDISNVLKSPWLPDHPSPAPYRHA